MTSVTMKLETKRQGLQALPSVFVGVCRLLERLIDLEIVCI